MIQDWDKAYNNSVHIENANEFINIWRENALVFRRKLQNLGRAKLDINYGNTEREKYDLFYPKDHIIKGLIFIAHGGYWKAFDKSYWSHLAQGACHQGYVVCIPSYTLAPNINLSGITKQFGRAIEHAAKSIEGPIYLIGHSAGGHLVTRMITMTSPLSDEVFSRIHTTLSISGIHDLRSLLFTQMKNTLDLKEEEAILESPVLLRPKLPCNLICCVGSSENSEMIRQTDLLANIWTGLGAKTHCLHIPNKHHFNIISDLSSLQSHLINNMI